MSLILRYPLDGTYNLTPENTAQPSYGSGVTIVDDNVLGKVAQFNGTTTAYVLGPTLTFDETPRTIMYWLYTNSLVTSFAHSLGPWLQDYSTWSTLILSSGLRFALNKSYVTTEFPVSTWVHVCETYDGSTMSQYFDGIQVSSSSNISLILKPLPLYLGQNPKYVNLQLNGKMSDYRVYDFGMGLQEINEIYSLGANPAPVEIPATIQMSSRGSTSISFLVEGDPNVDYNVVVADQVVDNVKSGDTVVVHDLKPNANYDVELFKVT